MKRLLAITLSGAFVLMLGCSQSYEVRLNKTLEQLRYMQRLDQYLQPAAAGQFQELAIFLRPPKPLQEAQAKALVGLTEEPGRYDLAVSFLGQPPAAPKAEGGQQPPQQPQANQGTPPRIIRLHVLARVKMAKRPGAATAKKAEEAPVEAVVPRGDFVTDVRTLLASDYGAGEEVLSEPLKNDKKKSNDYKRLVFPAPSNGDDIRVFFYKQGEYDVALIWDIPPDQVKSPTVTTGMELCLEILAVGPRAQRAFSGAVVGDEEIGGGGPPADSAAGGQAF